jgi:hypothetical protein
VGFASHFVFSTGFFGGIAALLCDPTIVLWICLPLIYLLGSAKGAIRMEAASKALLHVRPLIRKYWWMYCLGWPIVSLLFLYNFVHSSLTRRICWRGVRYELRSPVETTIIQ